MDPCLPSPRIPSRAPDPTSSPEQRGGASGYRSSAVGLILFENPLDRCLYLKPCRSGCKTSCTKLDSGCILRDPRRQHQHLKSVDRCSVANDFLPLQDPQQQTKKSAALAQTLTLALIFLPIRGPIVASLPGAWHHNPRARRLSRQPSLLPPPPPPLPLLPHPPPTTPQWAQGGPAGAEWGPWPP